MNVHLLDELSAAELVSSEALMQMTGLTLPVCEAFHAAFVNLVEDVGDFDGLIVTPHLLVVGRDDRVDAALDWLARQRRRRAVKAAASVESNRSTCRRRLVRSRLGRRDESFVDVCVRRRPLRHYLLDEATRRCRPLPILPTPSG